MDLPQFLSFLAQNQNRGNAVLVGAQSAELVKVKGMVLGVRMSRKPARHPMVEICIAEIARGLSGVQPGTYHFQTQVQSLRRESTGYRADLRILDAPGVVGQRRMGRVRVHNMELLYRIRNRDDYQRFKVVDVSPLGLAGRFPKSLGKGDELEVTAWERFFPVNPLVLKYRLRTRYGPRFYGLELVDATENERAALLDCYVRLQRAARFSDSLVGRAHHVLGLADDPGPIATIEFADRQLRQDTRTLNALYQVPAYESWVLSLREENELRRLREEMGQLAERYENLHAGHRRRIHTIRGFLRTIGR